MNIKKTIKDLWPLQAVELFAASDSEGRVTVYQYKDFRTLVFDNSHLEQGKVRMGDPLYLDHEYLQAMLLPILQMKPRQVTLLGLGAGSLANCLYYIFHDAKITAVEWRRTVITIAHEFFDLPTDNRLNIVCQEAMDWLKKAENVSTDLILSDLYHADRMHDVQQQRAFYEECSRVLTQKGWLAVNYCGFPRADSPVMAHICRSFSSAFVVHVKSGNWVLVATKQEISLPMMMAAPNNNNVPNSLLQMLKLHQGRLLKVNSRREKNA